MTVRLPLFGEPGAPSFEEVGACVHCGLCLEACPTYRELRVEMDSPRGRLYLMKGLFSGRLAPAPEVLRHLDQCLDCRACETACPSGVPYGHVLEEARTALEPVRTRGPVARTLRWLFFSWLLPSRRAQGFVFALYRLARALGLVAAGAWLARVGILRGRLGAAAAQAPAIAALSFRAAEGRVFPARGAHRRKVALFTGCLADHLFAEVNAATVRVLTENGCEVTVVADEACCGALHIHNGARDRAKGLARANLAAFAGDHDAIVVNAAGCSAELRAYDHLLGPEAAAFAGKIRDVSEYLAEIGCKPATKPGRVARVAYDEPCHLLHAQRISAAPRALLGAIPGLTLVPLADADSCCGSAGVYSVLEPQLAGPIRARKIAAIAASGADIVATGNPGCLMQIRAGVAAAGLRVTVVHPVELLAEAYRASFEA